MGALLLELQMKVLLVIDHFGSGGAQRQMVELAIGLKKAHRDVEMFVYYPNYSFMRSQVEAADIQVHAFDRSLSSPLGVLAALARLLRREKYALVVSFLDLPNIYAELATLFAPHTKLVVSERNSRLHDRSRIGALARRLLHCIADFVVTNNHDHAEWLRRHQWLRRKVLTIYNGVDLERHDFAERRALRKGEDLQLIGVGRVRPEKNIELLILALRHFVQRNDYLPNVVWVGEGFPSSETSAYMAEIRRLLAAFPELERRWRWLGRRNDVPRLLFDADALVLPSLYEGLPNVICEAFATGRPVIASRVCDHPILLGEDERGYLFDPYNALDLCKALERLASLSDRSWRAIGARAKAYARSELSVERMTAAFEALFDDLHRQRG